MAETAARLVDRIWPERRARQWVLSLPFELRLRVAFDRALLGELLGIFAAELRADLCRRAAALGLARGDTGTVTHIQRFGGSLNLNVHFHTLALDGVYLERDGDLAFATLPAPSDDEVAALLKRVIAAIRRRLRRRGVLDRDGALVPASAAHDDDLLAELAAASVQSRIATGPARGRRVGRLGDHVDVDHVDYRGPRCAAIDGFSLHADVAIDPATLKKLLGALGLPTEGPSIAPARGPPQGDLGASRLRVAEQRLPASRSLLAGDSSTTTPPPVS